jgi:hypothetical protein
MNRLSFLSLGVMLLLVSTAQAEFVNGDFENTTLINQSSWTAGTDSFGNWYAGPDMAIVGSTGSKYLANQVTGSEVGFALIRDVLQAFPMPAAGTYNFDVGIQVGTDYDHQFAGFNVLLAKTGVTFPLSGTGYYLPANMNPPPNSVDILDWDPGAPPWSIFDGNWHNISNSFTITPQQAADYQYLVFYHWGDRNLTSNMPMNLDNFSTTAPIPEPSTLVLLVAGVLAGGISVVKRRRSS